jgi:hypothetical protein
LIPNKKPGVVIDASPFLCVAVFAELLAVEFSTITMLTMSLTYRARRSRNRKRFGEDGEKSDGFGGATWPCAAAGREARARQGEA